MKKVFMASVMVRVWQGHLQSGGGGLRFGQVGWESGWGVGLPG